jgi:leucyl-tRNA synthetase
MYDHKAIEKKWKDSWRDQNLYKTKEDPTKPKYYILDMFPYPSGSGLHVGHPKGYIATDIFARLRLMQGYNVLHPMGWDAFGLPAENFAIKNKLHPRTATEKNVATYKRQLELLGFCYDWEREINTTDPEYYKWTQWMFREMFNRGLVYESQEPINWCPSCKTGLANEDLEDGKCERCGSEIELKPLRQWVIQITTYADRLLNDLDKLPDWEDSIKEMQRNWIGKSEGAEIEFAIKGGEEKIKVFTTRVDTIFGCTYVVIAPENKLIDDLKDKLENREEISAYRETVKNKSALERTDLNKDKTGVLLKGIKAVNPFTGDEVSVFAADYVLNNYGTGAVMAVPAHDERDFEFAHKYSLEIKTVIVPDKSKTLENPEISACFTEDGILENSGAFTGLSSAVARQKMIDWLEENKHGNRRVNYKIKDWVFSRQRYWGEPIPIVHCPACAKRIHELLAEGKNPEDFGFNQGEVRNPGAIAVTDEQLPVVLPEVESYEPSGTGESPLATIMDWVNTVCPKCGGPAKRETNTMPQWAGSSWYYLRYIDPKNDQVFAAKDKEKYWSPVDFYVGGAEHATRHLIYARFWHKFLFDIGAVSYDEPFTKLQHVGLIMGEDGRKMSKRWGNVINPDDIVDKFGADALRVYEMFMSPFADSCAWNTNGLIGARKFLDRVNNIVLTDGETDKSLKSILHKTIKKIGEDIENFKFNTAVSQMMIFINAVYEKKNINKQDFSDFILILAPFAPHLAEELWEKTGHKDSVFVSNWPQYSKELIKDETINLIVQVNGKVRAILAVPADIDEAAALAAASADSGAGKYLADAEIIKKIFVPGKILNIVVK